MTSPTLFSIVIVSLNGEDQLPMTLRAVQALEWERKELIVVDNGSTDRTSQVVVDTAPEAVLIRSEKNLGFAGGNNLGLEKARGDAVILLNDDCEPRADWLQALDEAMRERPDGGVFGCKLLYPDGETLQHAGGVMEPNGLTHHVGYLEKDTGQHDRIESRDYVTGAAFAIRRETLENIGLLDPGYFPIYFEENDYCARARRAGYEIYYVPRAVAIHHESRTTGKMSHGFLRKYHRNRLRFLVLNFQGAQLLRAIRREAGWLIRHRPFDSAIPLVFAYGSVLFNLPSLLRTRRTRKRRTFTRRAIPR